MIEGEGVGEVAEQRAQNVRASRMDKQNPACQFPPKFPNMPESAPEPKIANMQNLINQIAGTRPNTIISGSANAAAAPAPPEAPTDLRID